MKEASEIYQLIKAIKRNDLKKIEILVATKMDVNEYYQGMTPLCIAAMNGSVPTLKLLIEKGADINKPSQGTNFTPLSLAVSYAKRKAAYFLRDCGALHEEKNIFVENLRKTYPDIEFENPYSKQWKIWESSHKL